MDRTKFFQNYFNETTQVNELDYLYNNLSKMALKYSTSRYRVSEQDLMRPDLISYKVYGTVNYWWVILVINNIQNPFLDLSVGQMLLIPNENDLYDFRKKYRLR